MAALPLIAKNYSTTLKSSYIALFLKSIKKSTNVDVIDCFANELVEEKTQKWEIIRNTLKQQQTETNCSGITKHLTRSANIKQDIKSLKNLKLFVDIKILDQIHIDHLLRSAIADGKTKTVNEFIDHCIKLEKIPSNEVIIEVLQFLSKLGDLNRLTNVANFCKIANNEFYISTANFNHYIAWCMWIQGNLDGSLDLLKCTYSMANEDVKKSLRNIFRNIINETVGNKSEAVLVVVTKVAIQLNTDYGELFVIAHLWKSCFISSWFSDQQLAKELFENSDQLRLIVSKQANVMSYNFLREHNVEAVHRLIESFLKFNMKQECKICLSLLFDYQHWRKNLRACSEIMRNSLDLDIPLSDMHNQKLINLLLGYTSPIGKQKEVISKFELKF